MNAMSKQVNFTEVFKEMKACLESLKQRVMACGKLLHPLHTDVIYGPRFKIICQKIIAAACTNKEKDLRDAISKEAKDAILIKRSMAIAKAEKAIKVCF
jgi:hypothetical protein